MAHPPLVLLHRKVYFSAAAGVPGDASKDGSFTVGSIEEAAAIRGSSLCRTPIEAMATMKADPIIVDPPEVSYLSMQLQVPRYLSWRKVPHCGDVSSTDKYIVVIYSDFYRPGTGSGSYRPDGCYLVFDASNNNLTAIPPIPYSDAMRGLGRSAVALRRGNGVGEYTLTDVFTCYPDGLPEATLCVWSPSSAANPDGEWIQTPIKLPLPAHLCGHTTNSFKIDMAFAFAGCIVWVDLLTGIIICDLSSAQGPMFRFIALPKEAGCLKKPASDRLRSSPETLRSIACVCGMIKFVTLVGVGNCPIGEVKLQTWTLCPDFRGWMEGDGLCVGQIWMSESYTETRLPQRLPLSPVLSITEDGIVYAVINDFELADRLNEFGCKKGEKVVPKGSYIVRIDMLENKVMSSARMSTKDLTWFIRPNLIATDFNAYLQASSKDARGDSSTSNVQKSTYKKRTCSLPAKNTVKKIYRGIANAIKDCSADDTSKSIYMTLH